MVEINQNFDRVKNLFGEKCCRCKVDRFGGLILGFGKKIEHNNPKLSDSFRGEWEVIIFEPSWELLIDGVTYVNDKEKQIQNILKTIIGKKILNFDKTRWAVVLENDIVFSVNKDTFDAENEDSYMHVFNMDENIYSFSVFD